ncbi:protein PHYTOCHROME KINASE SUBSTRATE 1-like [Chenopodium quinoa]|uniref:protein PHYTOCHROME KINASE SUBSTRATE 1-like n=1 Tax=Chenopodium quinoa TaxID=63459 RepID=UPI000B76F744|nr:protein PHYTOCHROME KINASE SUBSTRATE 1-like [Chenopodium quinoa]
MASLSPTSTRLSLPPSWSSESNNSSLREASFSSYLNSSEETYIRSLIESSQNQLLSKPLQQQQQQQHDHLHNSRQKKAEDKEIDVFSADKYFSSEIIDQERSNSARSKSARFQLSEELHNHEERPEGPEHQIVRVNSNKLKSQFRTPSSQSELSSNSQSALLRRLHRTPSRSTNNGKTMSLLSCSCCVNRKSVDIDREFTNHSSRGGITDGRPPAGYSKGTYTRSIKTSFDTAEITRMNKLHPNNTIEPFVFPVTDSASLAAVNKLINVEEEEARKSLEVFGFSDLDDGSKRFSLQKRLNMLSWDAIPRTDEISTSGAPSETYKDTESDASSDLFEIECLSCTSNPVIQRPRLVPSDGSTTPTTAYAPSEASIEWSVVTASAADFSIASDSEDQRSRAVPSGTRYKSSASKSSPFAKRGMSKEVQKPGSGLLLGCKSQKAVNVAQEVHRKSPARGISESQRKHRLSDSFTPVTRFQVEAKLPGFVHRQRKSLSPELLYIQ